MNFADFSRAAISYKIGKQLLLDSEAVAPWFSVKKAFLKILQNSQKKTPVLESLFKLSCRPQASNFIKKETPTQVFSCEFCEISKNTFLIDPLY